MPRTVRAAGKWSRGSRGDGTHERQAGRNADSPCEWGCERAAKGICGLLFLGAAETFLPISAAVSVQFICDELSLMSLFFVFFFPAFCG